MTIMMKKSIFSIIAISMIALGACTDMNEMLPEGGTVLDSQFEEIIEADPSRADAIFNGMYTKMGEPAGIFPGRPDDFGFLMQDFSNDLEAGDVMLPNSTYNWWRVCGKMTTRNADKANAYIRYASCYLENAATNDVLKILPKDSKDPEIIAKRGQAHALRAYTYMRLAPYFQFNYQDAKDKPCVPIVDENTTEFTENPRATVEEVYNFILSDLESALTELEGFQRPNKGRVDQQVVYGLLARVYLNMENYQEALKYAEKAAEGFTPASIEEVSHPSFMDISEHNWIWGYDMTTVVASYDQTATASGWIRPFSANAYGPYTGTYAYCNNILYEKIPDTDVRKGWWVDENLESPLLDGEEWDGLEGNDIAKGYLEDVKDPFLPLTNVKFGCYTMGTMDNDEDWPFMRVEEMLLIQAECQERLGNTGEAVRILTDFVKTYRDPSYDPKGRGLSLLDEIWFQRRVELWGEGLANNDTRRLRKPFVRFTDAETSNVPDAFRFNIAADDPWLLLRFPRKETNTNMGIIDNTGGETPVQDQNAGLRDGVTD